MIGHDGDVPGYQSVMYYLPEHDATIVGFGNLYGWSVRGMPASTLVKAAADHCFPKRSEPNRCRFPLFWFCSRSVGAHRGRLIVAGIAIALAARRAVSCAHRSAGVARPGFARGSSSSAIPNCTSPQPTRFTLTSTNPFWKQCEPTRGSLGCTRRRPSSRRRYAGYGVRHTRPRELLQFEWERHGRVDSRPTRRLPCVG